MNFGDLMEQVWISLGMPAAAQRQDFRRQEIKDAINTTLQEVASAPPFMFRLARETTLSILAGQSVYTLDDWCMRMLSMYTTGNAAHKVTMVEPRAADRDGSRNPNAVFGSLGPWRMTWSPRTQVAAYSGAAGATTGASVSEGEIEISLPPDTELLPEHVGRMFRLNGEGVDYRIVSTTRIDIAGYAVASFVGTITTRQPHGFSVSDVIGLSSDDIQPGKYTVLGVVSATVFTITLAGASDTDYTAATGRVYPGAVGISDRHLTSNVGAVNCAADPNLEVGDTFLLYFLDDPSGSAMDGMHVVTAVDEVTGISFALVHGNIGSSSADPGSFIVKVETSVTVDRPVRARITGQGVTGVGAGYTNVRWEIGPPDRIQLQMLPAPTEALSVNYRYMSRPRLLINTDETPELPDDMHHLLWKGALKYIRLSKQDQAMAGAYRQEYMEGLALLQSSDQDTQDSNTPPDYASLGDDYPRGLPADVSFRNRNDGY